MGQAILDKITSALRWSEQYTKTDMVYLVSRGGFSVFAQIIISIGVLIFAVVVGHVLPKETYGEYKYVLSIISLLSLFTLTGIGGAVFQSTAQGHGGALRTGFWANIRWSVVVFAGSLVAAVYYFLAHNTQLATEILIGGCLSPFIASANLYSPYLAGKKAFIRQMFYSIVDNLLTIGIMVVTVLLTQSPLILIAVYFISNALAALFFYYRTEQLYEAHEGTTDEGMLTYSKHLSALGVFGGIVETIDQILIFHFAGAAQLAIFAFATALPDQMKTPLKTLNTMVQVGFIERTPSEIHAGIKNKIFWYLLFLLGAVVAYAVAAPYIFKWFFPAYVDSVLYSQIYMLWILSVALDPALSYLGSRKKVRELYISGIFFTVCQAITMIIGVIWWGILGLIVAQVGTRIVSAFLNYILYTRAIHYEIKERQS